MMLTIFPSPSHSHIQHNKQSSFEQKKWKWIYVRRANRQWSRFNQHEAVRDRREEIRVDGNAIKTSAVDIIKRTRRGDFDFALCRCSHDSMLKFAELSKDKTFWKLVDYKCFVMQQVQLRKLSRGRWASHLSRRVVLLDIFIDSEASCCL